jgi:hypothetical protein
MLYITCSSDSALVVPMRLTRANCIVPDMTRSINISVLQKRSITIKKKKYQARLGFNQEDQIVTRTDLVKTIRRPRGRY